MDMNEFKDESINSPLIQELTSILGDNTVKLPYIEKDKIIMSPGIWNQKNYSADEIKKGFTNTDWTEKQVKFLFYDHEDRKASEWVGEIANEKCSDDGTVTADLIFYDPILAIKLAYGKPKIGVSPKVRGRVVDNEMRDFVYENFSVVVVPAVKTAWINNSEGNKTIDIDGLKNEVKQMVEEIKPVEEIKNEQVQLSEELQAFVSFYNSEKTKNPEATLKDVCNAFASKDDLPEDKKEEEPKEEEKPEVPKEPEMKQESSVDSPAETSNDILSEVKKENEELKKIVQTMSDNMSKLTEKLDSIPERLTSNGPVSQELSNKQDSDTAFLNYLKTL